LVLVHNSLDTGCWMCRTPAVVDHPLTRVSQLGCYADEHVLTFVLFFEPEMLLTFSLSPLSGAGVYNRQYINIQ
ncbi:unnamed protein product, partial [Ectocarpus fasciculatus]